MRGIKLHEVQTLNSTIQSLAAKGYTKTYIEKALRLPFGTLNKWLSFQDIDPAGLVLFRILNVFPWMIDVADNNYEVMR